MATKADLQSWVLEALIDLGGEAPLVRVAEAIWKKREGELRTSGDLFYTWQYDMRWAAQELQDIGKIEKFSRSWKLR